MYKIVHKRVWLGGGSRVKWTIFVLEFFVGAIKPMDQLIKTVGLNFEEKSIFEPP